MAEAKRQLDEELPFFTLCVAPTLEIVDHVSEFVMGGLGRRLRLASCFTGETRILASGALSA